MDWNELLQTFLKSVDLVLVVGIILFSAALFWVLDGFKLKIGDGWKRTIVLALGLLGALMRTDFAGPLTKWGFDLVGRMFAYGGAATVIYQLYRHARNARKAKG